MYNDVWCMMYNEGGSLTNVTHRSTITDWLHILSPKMPWCCDDYSLDSWLGSAVLQVEVWTGVVCNDPWEDWVLREVIPGKANKTCGVHAESVARTIQQRSTKRYKYLQMPKKAPWSWCGKTCNEAPNLGIEFPAWFWRWLIPCLERPAAQFRKSK